MAHSSEAEIETNSERADVDNVLCEEQTGNYSLTLTISADEMSAAITLVPHLKDNQLITPEQVLNILDQHNIVDGIDLNAIEELCHQVCNGKEQRKIVVAATAAPQPGADGWIEALNQIEKNKKLVFEEDEKGRVDLYTLNLFKCVEAGQQIAIVHPPENGEPSSTVTGKLIPPIPGKEVEIRMGEGVRTEDNGTTFISNIAGRADLTDNIISVSEDYIIHGDVDLEVGNITFPGYTEVRGDVLDTFDIYSKKGIKTNGAVGACHLISDGDITIGSMSGRDDGFIRCGGNLKANYLNGVTVECMGSVIVNNEIRNCTIKSADSIMIKNGVISGGECIALNGIEAKDIGAEAGVITKVQSGVYFPEADRLQTLKTQQKSISLQNQFIKRCIGPLKTQATSGSNCKDVLQKRLDILLERQELLKTMQVEVKQQLDSFVFEEHDSNAKINVHRRLKEKVIIALETVTEEIRLERDGPLSVVADVSAGRLRFCTMTPLDINANDAQWDEEEDE